MKRLFSFITRHWPIFTLVIVELILFLTNMPTNGHWLLGWDSTTPELNSSLNFSRFFYGVWQEYRGLGTLDGMAHIANLPHWLYSLLLDLFLPANTVRPILNLLLHLFGGIGTYYLIKDFVTLYFLSRNDEDSKKSISLVGAIFYQFNLLTIQMFFLPLELFSFHFAVLPWALWTLFQYFKQGTTRWLLYFAFVNLAGVSQAHVPTVAISYGLALLIPALTLAMSKVITIKQLILAFSVLALVHSFWGVPYLYSTLTKSAEISNSKQNVIGTPSVFYRNNAWATVSKLGTFGGLGLGYQDWDEDTEKFEPVMQEWLRLWNNPLYKIFAFTIFSFACLSSLALLRFSFKKRYYVLLSFVVLWFAFFTLLATDIPPFSFISDFLREFVPLYSQIFRFTFTKFSTVYALALSVMLCAGLLLLRDYFAKTGRDILIKRVSLGVVLTTLLFAYPAFTHSFFYKRLWVNLPQEYFTTANFINSSNSQNRIATFPIHSVWGWTTNTTHWGYRGSGFFWQMSSAPLVDRSFDPWSKYNETSFLQLNQAVYTSNGSELENTLKKYHINQVLLDRSVFHPGNYPKNLFIQEIDGLLNSISSSKLSLREGSLELHSFLNAPGTELSAPKQIIQANETYFSDYSRKDYLYGLYGDYVLSKEGSIFPFSYFQSDRNIQPYTTVQDNHIKLTAAIPENSNIQFTPFAQAEKVVPASLSLGLDKTTLTLDVQVPLPQNSSISTKRTFSLSSPTSQVIVSSANDVILLDSKSSSERPSVLTLPTQEAATFYFFSAIPDTSEALSLNDQNKNCVTSYTSLEADNISTYKCTLTALPQPTTSDSKKLLGLTLEYKSEDFLSPDLCVHLKGSKECLNKPLNGLYGSNSDWQQLTLAIPLTNTNPMELEMRTSENGISTKTTEYRNLYIYYHSNLESINFDTPALLTFVDEQFTNSARTSNELEINIPTGSNNQFVIEPELAIRGKSDHLNCASGEKGLATKETSIAATRYTASQEGVVCDTLYLPELLPSQEYLLSIKGQNYGGVGLKFFVTNPLTKRFDLEQITPKGEFDLLYSIWPSRTMDNTTSDVFTFDISGESYGKELNKTDIDSIKIFPLPLSWLSQIHTVNPNYFHTIDSIITNQKKISPIYYQATIEVNSEEGLLVLPQGFDAGWIAFSQSFHTFSKVNYNGWANAWIIPKGTWKITILYWPQLFFLTGLLFSMVTLLMLFLRRNKASLAVPNKYFIIEEKSNIQSLLSRMMLNVRLFLVGKLRK